MTAPEVTKIANALLRANNRPPTATQRWAGEYIRCKKHLFHSVKTTSKAWARKAAQQKDDIRKMYDLYLKTKEEEGIYADNEWNADESGFRVGVVQSGKTVWTYVDIKVVESLNPDDCTLVTVVEAISAAGRSIPAFVILSGQLLRVKHLDNRLDDATVLTTSLSGYTDNQLSLEWFKHWERNTRPLYQAEKRLLLLDNYRSHCTVEFFEGCVAANVLLFLLPPYTTHYC